MIERQSHPFAPFIPKKAIALIIGTAPPWNFCTGNPADLREGEMAFFYGSIHNLFWYVIKAVFEPNNPRWPRNRLQCESFLKRNNLGIGDILDGFDRKDQRAADDHLSGFKFNQQLLAKLLSETHDLQYLYFTSQFAHDLFLKALKQHEVIYHIHSADRIRKSALINLQKGRKIRTYTCFVLTSPSPRINRTLEDMLEDYSEQFAVIKGELD